MKQLRIATIGDYHNWFSYFLMGTAQGSFLNGHLHCSIPIRQRIEEIKSQIDYFRPHIIFCHMIFSKNILFNTGRERLEPEELHDILRYFRSKFKGFVVYQEGDAKIHPRWNQNISDFVDLVLLNNKQTEVFSKVLGVPCIHWPYFCLNQKGFSLPDNMYRAKIVFTGNVSKRNRMHLHYYRFEFLEKLKSIFELKIFPNDDVKNTRFSSQEVAVSADVVLGINQGMHVPGYLDTRPFQYIGAGAFFFIDPSESMNLFFEPNVHYVPYQRHNVEDLKEKIDYYLVHNKDKVSEIRKTGFEYTQKWHSAKQRVAMVLDLIEGKDKKYPIYLTEIREIENEHKNI